VKIKVFWIGKTKESAIQALTDEYLKRIRRFADVDGVSLKDEASLIKAANAGKGNRSFLILLDSRGKQMSSEELARYIGDHQDRNPLPIAFAIGPADGFNDSARQKADLLLSFGRMTLAHELARVVLLEQLYRAFSILKGHPYHMGH